MRSRERRRLAAEIQALGECFGGARLLDEPERPHAPEDAAPRRAARSGCCHGLKRDGCCGSAARNAACAGVSIEAGTPKYARLARSAPAISIPVRRDVEIEREDLALRQAVLQPQREKRLVQLGAGPATRRLTAGPLGRSRAQELHYLLRERRPALDDASLGDVGLHRSSQRDRVDARMEEEPMVLGGERRVDQDLRKRVRRQRLPAQSAAAPRLVERHAVAIDHDRGVHRRQVEKVVGQRAEADPGSEGEDDGYRRARRP